MDCATTKLQISFLQGQQLYINNGKKAYSTTIEIRNFQANF